MVSTMRPGQEQTLARPSPNGGGAATTTPATREIPYDFVARFRLSGKPGDRQLDVFNVSTDGAFVAVSVAHSFEPAQFTLKHWCANPVFCSATSRGNNQPAGAINVLFGTINLPDLCDNKRGSPGALPGEDTCDVSTNGNNAEPIINAALGLLDVRRLLLKLLDLQFKYSIIDSGSGRELQNLPIPNISGLGNANGDRPFRTFPKPMIFMPRSTIRVEVEEVSRGPLYAGGELTLVLHGYKILGYDR
jgi:hypothetical protein